MPGEDEDVTRDDTAGECGLTGTDAPDWAVQFAEDLDAFDADALMTHAQFVLMSGKTRVHVKAITVEGRNVRFQGIEPAAITGVHFVATDGEDRDIYFMRAVVVTSGAELTFSLPVDPL